MQAVTQYKREGELIGKINLVGILSINVVFTCLKSETLIRVIEILKVSRLKNNTIRQL